MKQLKNDKIIKYDVLLYALYGIRKDELKFLLDE